MPEGGVLVATSVPLHSKIYDDIRQQIIDARLRPGDMLPQETELQRLYGASRAPVRQAMGRLEHDGLIVRMQGKGTFVTDRSKTMRWLLFAGFRDFYKSHFDELSCRTISIEYEDPDPATHAALLLRYGQKVLRIVRVRSWKGLPVFAINTFLPDTMNAEPFRRAGAVFNITDVLRDSFSIHLETAEEYVTAVLADEETSRLLDVKSGSPLLQIERFNYDQSRTVIYFTRYYARSDIVEYRSVFGANADETAARETKRALTPPLRKHP